MKKILNTLYITNEEAYLSLDGENVVVNTKGNEKKKFPLHILESIITFSYKGASPALMGKCSENNINLCFFTPYGKYLASVNKTVNGNVHLRREQFRIADNEEKSIAIARTFITGKLYNAKYVLFRYIRDHKYQVDVDKIKKAINNIEKYLLDVKNATSKDSLRGIEGNSAAEYFSCFDELILQNKADFHFSSRSRRPPEDKVNALLSFAYSLLNNDCCAALFGVGLDPYVGFLHTDKPGRKSLALDIMEELRNVYADKFVLALINNRQILPKDFVNQESGAVILSESGRKKFLSEWQKRKKETLVHPYIKEKIEWGFVPHVQALLLSRYLRGDLDNYPPFFWR